MPAVPSPSRPASRSRCAAGARAAALRATRRRLLVGSLLAVTVHAFDELSVVTVLPVVTDELGGRALYGAALYAYLLASLVGLVLGGGAATRRGPAAAFGLGLGAFAAGLALGAAAPAMEGVVAGRALQGLGGGVLSATVLVVVNRGFDAEARPRVMAWNASAWVLPALVAPAAAGALAEWASWRWVFAGLLPVVGLAAVLGLPAMRGLGTSGPARGLRGELADGLRLAAGLGLALAALARAAGLATPVAVGAGLAVAWAPLARALPDGVARLRPGRAAAVGVKILLVFAFFGAEAFVPLALIEIHGVSAATAGLALTGAALAWTAGAHVQSRLASRLPAAWLAGAGAAAIALGVATLLAMLDPRTPLVLAFAAWALSGLGMGLAYTTATVSAMAHTSPGGEGATATALGIADAVAVSVATGLGGAAVAAAERAGAPAGAALAPIWLGTGAAALVAALAARRLMARAPSGGDAGSRAPAATRPCVGSPG